MRLCRVVTALLLVSSVQPASSQVAVAPTILSIDATIRFGTFLVGNQSAVRAASLL
ncbi:MAG: hypothetical protein ACRELD_02075 [Longimicrobiales bacterium]